MTRGEKRILLRLVYRLETVSEAIGERYWVGDEDSALRQRYERERVELRRQIEATLGFSTASAPVLADG
jgi:hypothetical protein